MADLRGEQLKDSYQNLVTRGTGSTPIEDGNGSPYFYEEGTWSPTFETSGEDFDSISYTDQSGTYIKNGRLVIISFDLEIDNVTIGDAGGNLLLANFPFLIGNQHCSLGVVFASDFKDRVPFSVQARLENNNGFFRQIDQSTPFIDTVAPSNVQSGTRVMGSGVIIIE